MPWLAFVFVMSHMSVSHVARMAASDPSSVDVTGAQMVLLMKLSAFAWNVADGTLPDESLSDFQRDRRLAEMPGLLDFAGYVFFFPSLLVGPAFDFAEYRRWLDCTMFDVPATVDPAKKPPTRRKRKIPRSGTPAAWKLVGGLVWIVLFLKLSALYYPSVLLENEFPTYGFAHKLWVLHMVGFTARAKYYGVWTLTEGACILTGLGYNGVDPVTGKVSWDRLRNISPGGVEFAQNCRGYLESWNINTNSWLRNYVYLRVTPRGKKPGFRASLATFTTSAFWHGFYPGYYLTFVLASFIQTVAKSESRPAFHSCLKRRRKAREITDRHQTSAATSAPSSSIRPRRPPYLQNATTTSSPSSSRRSPSPSPSRPSSSSASAARSSSGRGCTSTPSSARPRAWPSSRARPRSGLRTPSRSGLLGPGWRRKGRRGRRERV
jgi:lysophospholipid acyltransferase